MPKFPKRPFRVFELTRDRRPLILLVLFLAFGAVVAYLSFSNNGPIPLGDGLSKADWLQFTGMYLAFSGALLIGVLSFMQQESFNRAEEKRFEREKEEERTRRMLEIRPLLSIEPLGIGERVDECGSRVLIMNELRITNAGSYPICNVTVDLLYAARLLPPGGSCLLTPEQPWEARLKGGLGFAQGLEEDFRLNVAFDDYDGYRFTQHFVADLWGCELYFALLGAESDGDMLSERDCEWVLEQEG